MKKIKPKENTSDNSNKMNAQKFYEVVMRNVDDKINSAMLQVKREMKEQGFMVKSLRNGVLSLELDFKSLGIALGQLGITEINILNQTKNSVRDKISVVSNDGKVYGGLEINRYNLIAKDGILVNL